MLRRNECRLNFENRLVRTGDLKGGPKQPPLPLIGVARSLPLIGLSSLLMYSLFAFLINTPRTFLYLLYVRMFSIVGRFSFSTYNLFFSFIEANIPGVTHGFIGVFSTGLKISVAVFFQPCSISLANAFTS